VTEVLTWRNGKDAVLATEERRFHFQPLPDRRGSFWTIRSAIRPAGAPPALRASRAARYRRLELRLGPPFSDARHRTDTGLRGHEAIMGKSARWCCAVGAGGGAVVMLDHPANPRHPTTWFTRRNLLGAGLLMSGDLTVAEGEVLNLHYGFAVLDDDPPDAWINAIFDRFARG